MKRVPVMAVMLVMVVSLLGFASIAIAETSADAALDKVLAKLFVDYEQIFGETTEELIANGGENFFLVEGNGELSTTEEGLQFWVGSELYDENSIFNFTTRVDTKIGEVEQKRAIHIKFKTTTNKMEIGLWGNFGVITSMDKKHKLYFHLPDYGYNKQYKNITLKAGQWYHFLMGVDADGLFQGAIWKDGDVAHAAYINQAIGESLNEPNYQRQSWEPSVQIWGEATFTIECYEYYSFTDFVKEGQTVKATKRD